MEFLQLPFNTIIAYFIPFIVALTIIVFIHEFGHYYIARLCGVKIETFSIGFGKEIVGWHDAKGTRWKLCWLPLGGYVKFHGDANGASLPSASPDTARDPGNFHGKKIWQRAAVVAAGPFANFIAAIFIFAGIYMFVGERVADPVVGTVLPGSVAAEAGMKPGDIIKKIDGKAITTFNELQTTVFDRAGDTIALTLDRQGSTVELEVVPRVEEIPDGFGGKSRVGRLGIQASADPSAVRTITYGFPDAVVKGAKQTWFVIRTTLRYMGKMIMGRESPDQLRGPVGIMQIAGGAAASGLLPFLSFIGLISVSIGLINLFPVPMLDGGHLVYYSIEALRGKPLGQKAQEWGFRIGVSMVMLLLIVATWNDLVRNLGG